MSKSWIEMIWEIITAQIGTHIIIVTTVVKNFFRFKFGFVGADGGVPSSISPDSACEIILSGKTINRTKNQITANKTKAAEIVIIFTF